MSEKKNNTTIQKSKSYGKQFCQFSQYWKEGRKEGMVAFCNNKNLSDGQIKSSLFQKTQAKVLSDNFLRKAKRFSKKSPENSQSQTKIDLNIN